jgi:hypothetical protein
MTGIPNLTTAKTENKESYYYDPSTRAEDVSTIMK